MHFSLLHSVQNRMNLRDGRMACLARVPLYPLGVGHRDATSPRLKFDQYEISLWDPTENLNSKYRAWKQSSSEANFGDTPLLHGCISSPNCTLLHLPHLPFIPGAGQSLWPQTQRMTSGMLSLCIWKRRAAVQKKSNNKFAVFCFHVFCY